MKDLGFVIVDLAKFYGQWWLWVEIWWCHGGFVGFFWIWVLLLRWWLWLAEVVVMEDDDDWPSPPPSSCSRPIVRRGRTLVGNLGERETDSEKGERKSNKEMRGERKVE